MTQERYTEESKIAAVMLAIASELRHNDCLSKGDGSMAKGFLDRINKSTVAIGGVGGLITALTALYVPFEKYKLPQPYTSYFLGAIAAVLVVIVLRAAILAVPLRSVLRDPEAFVLRRELPEHLVGRKVDIDRLEQKLSETLLLFVEGESGVGKSALLRAGLVLRLKAGHRYLPVYVESLAGQDWVGGPWRALIPAFRAALDSKAPSPSHKPAAEAFDELLEAAHEAGRMPALIIDQFDDYQLSHGTLFLRAGTWLTAAELTAVNPFWAALHAALDENRLQLLIATRNDMALGLEAVRFIKPLPYHVDKVPPKYFRALIERLAGTASDVSGAIDAPLATWPDLRSRLLDDLASGGDILPQQLKVALLGLQGLPRQQLTTAAYAAEGGLRGLEANWIETQIDRAARKSKLSTSDILRILVALCDPDAVAKTRNLSLPAIWEVAGLEDHAAVETALMALEEGEVVRRLARVDSNESLWRLDHDYIAGVVTLANRRANRWELTLVEGRRALAGASGLIRKWEELLPFKTQIQFFLDRAKGRFRYERGRAYALISLARFAPAMLTVLLVTFGYHTIQTDTANREMAARIAAGFDTDTRLSEKEIQNLINLSNSNTSVARRVIGLMLNDPNLIENFITHERSIMAALSLAADGNWAALSEATEPFAEQARESKEVDLSYLVATLLDKADRASEAAALFVTAMEANKDDDHALRQLAMGLGVIGNRAPQEKTDLAATLLVAAMEENKDNAEALEALAAGLGAIGDQLPQKTASLAANHLVAVIEPTKMSAAERSMVAKGLGAIGDWVPQEAVGLVANHFITVMEANKSNVDVLVHTALDLRYIRDRVPQETAALAANHLIKAMEANKHDVENLSELAGALRVLGDRVPQEIGALVANHVIKVMEANKDDDLRLSQYALLLGTIGDRLPEETAGRAATLLVAAIEKGWYDDENTSFRPVDGLRAVGSRVPQETASRMATRLITAMEANKANNRLLSQLADGLSAIGDRVSKVDAQSLSNRFKILFPRCIIANSCHSAMIALHSVFSKERAIQLVFFAGRDPLTIFNFRHMQRLGRVTGWKLQFGSDWDAAEAWLRKHPPNVRVDDASIRKELRHLMRKRKTISEAKAPVEAT